MSNPRVIQRARISVNSRLTGLDPTIHSGLSAFVTQYLIWGQLFRLNDDNSATPQLAEGIEFLHNRHAAILRLKPGLTYSDGSAITSEDVVFAFERHRYRKGPRFFLLDSVESASPLDKLAVEFQLRRPCSNLVVGLADAGFSILPRSAIETDSEFFSHPISSGQYILKEWKPGESSWVLEENPRYFEGGSRIHQLEFVVVGDEAERIRQLNNGSLDYAYDLRGSAREELAAEVHACSVPIQGVEEIKFNFANSGPLANPKVRQAISLGIDRESICQRAYSGLAHPVKGFLYHGVPEALDILPKGGKRDLSGAIALLSECPWHEGFRFELQTWKQRPGRTEAAFLIQKDLSDLGIRVDVKPIEDAIAVTNLTTGNYEAQLSGNTQDPLTFLRNQFGKGGTITTKLRYDNPVITGLLVEASATDSAKERIALLHQVQRLAYEDMPVIPLCDRVVLVANRLGRDFIYEANRQPGFNPAVKTLGG